MFLTTKKTPKEKFYSIKNNPILQVNVTSAVKKIRPFIAAAVVKNLDLSGNRLKNLINFTEKFCETYGRKRKKIAVGLYNLDVITGPLTYDASKEEEFVPLGMKSKLKFSQILKEHEKGIEYSSIIGKRKLYPYLRDSKNILSLIPIINSEDSRVAEKTKNILVEFTGTSQKAVEEALNLIVCSFIDLEAEIYPCEIIYPNKKGITPNLEYKENRIKRSKVEKSLGIILDENKVIDLANRMGHVAAKYGNYVLVFAPPYRLDILNEQDITEDIAIAYGYDKIEPLPVFSASTGLPDESKEQSNKVSRLMIGLGFSESINPYLTNEQLNFDSVCHKKRPESTITVAYAKTETITMLRTDLLPCLMKNLSLSVNDKMPQKLFEIGNIFYLDNDTVVESNNLGIVSEHTRANFSEIKSVVLELLKSMGCSDCSMVETKDSMFIEGRVAKIVSGNTDLGYLGEIHPKVLENFKIEEPVVAAEIKLDKCIALSLKKQK